MFIGRENIKKKIKQNILKSFSFRQVIKTPFGVPQGTASGPILLEKLKNCALGHKI